MPWPDGSSANYHPLEPEMTLQLAMQWFPQVFADSKAILSWGGGQAISYPDQFWAHKSIPGGVYIYINEIANTNQGGGSKPSFIMKSTFGSYQELSAVA